MVGMQQRMKVTIDDNDDDDDDDVKQEVTDTIEKFVQNRHVQTLKYLRHVIDENRHLRLHIEHLKRRQDNPVESPAVVDPIDPEETPINEIVLETPEISLETPEVYFIFYLF
jgi:regulator of replication initiation timing